MFVHYYMTPDPLTIFQEVPVDEAYEILQKHHFRHLPVVNNNGLLRGMVTDRDLRSACPSSILTGTDRQEVMDKVSGTPVSTIMSDNFVSLRVESTLDDALLLFASRSIGALPVVESGGRVVGIFSVNDMMAAYRSLFGLGEKGSMLVAVQDTGETDLLSTLVQALEKKKIEFSRLVRSCGREGREPAAVYLRVNTCNLTSVNNLIENAGLRLMSPGWQEKEDRV